MMKKGQQTLTFLLALAFTIYMGILKIVYDLYCIKPVLQDVNSQMPTNTKLENSLVVNAWH